VEVLGENGADLNGYGANEHALLSTAILTTKLEIVKYLMIEKKAPIPDYVVVRQLGTKYEKKMTITDILEENDYKDSPDNQRLKQEILTYMRDQGRR